MKVTAIMANNSNGTKRKGGLITDYAKRSRSNNGEIFGIKTNNKFDKLAKSDAIPKPKVFRPPPITISDRTTDLIELTKDAGLTAPFAIKNTSIGRKVFVENNEDKTRFLKVLTEKHIHCFTHGDKNQKPSKFLLSGLEKVTTAELHTELSAANLPATQIYEIYPKNKKWDRDTMYLVHFDKKDNITLDALKKIRAIRHTIVHWKTYENKYNGPTQCRNCQMFGHGTSYCHMVSACMVCAQNHNTNTCPNKDNANFHYKCFNCSGNHKANDQNCPKKQEYVQIRQSANKRRPKQNVNNRNGNYVHNQKSFPPMRNVNAEPPRQAPATSYQSYANAAKSPKQQTNVNGNQSDNDSNRNSNSNLFTAAELMQVFNEITSRMGKCKTKEDQITLLFDIASKYV